MEHAEKLFLATETGNRFFLLLLKIQKKRKEKGATNTKTFIIDIPAFKRQKDLIIL